MPFLRARRCAVAALLFALIVVGASPAEAHTKGVSLSKYGMVDVSWTGNLALAAYSDYYNGLDPLKLGDRTFTGLNLTSFDLSLSQDLFAFPLKWALFTTWTQGAASIEESFFLFHKLPYFMQVKTGIFRVNFTKINQYHDHEWPFADPPLISTMLLGVDGVHNPGVELNFQPPTPFFTELSVSAMTGTVGYQDRTFPGFTDVVAGAQALNNFNYWSRATTFLPLTDDQDIEFGISGAVGKNKPQGLADGVANPQSIAPSNADMTALGGLDFTYTYKPRAFDPYVRWTTEYMFASRTNPIVLGLDRSKRLPDKPFADQITRTLKPSDLIGGMYSEVNYRFAHDWDLSGRVDVVGLPVGGEDPQTRVTESLRYFFNPVSRINLQHEYTLGCGSDLPYHTIMLQLNVGGGTVTPGVGKFYNLF